MEENMLSTIPFIIEKINATEVDKEILRVALIAELDAINLYEQLAGVTSNKGIKAVLLDIAREEKTHVGEFHVMLLRLDEEQVLELQEGKREVETLIT
jgi:rubrerythrin